ncbi:MAG: hypothetical protein IJ092_02565 [Atopobiaceae bacterium]|nr:hypothetical protein [Atopobiaceae bacterium]MBR1830764.1 hypothetical protein [Atopobiaceae bacterium]
MLASFPSSSLKTNQREVKDAALSEPVLVTDSDNQNYLFGNVQALTRATSNFMEEVSYERRILFGAIRGSISIARGDYISGTFEEVMAEMERRRLANG